MNKPLITVISTHHLNENDKYLHWSLKSILASVDVDIEVLCYSSAKECPEVPFQVTLIHDPVKYENCSAKFNAGIKMASPHSKFICMVADDVMISKYALDEMSAAIGDRVVIMGPASNCDSTTRYQAKFAVVNDLDNAMVIPQKCTLEEIVGFEKAIIDYPSKQRILIDPGWISFYCVMIPKSVVNAVGELDERMDVRWNDVDYCERARKLGIPSMINLGAFALHFGDRTLPKCTTPEQYAAADRAWMDKHRGLPIPEETGDLL